MSYKAGMIRVRLPIHIILIGILTLPGCIASDLRKSANSIVAIDVDEVENIPAAREFARLCLDDNYQVTKLIEFAKADGWYDADEAFLKNIGLRNLRREILRIPGGGGRTHETQAILKYNSELEIIAANLMERFDRSNKLVRTECALFVQSREYLPICAAIGVLLKKPPDSNSRFGRTGSHFIRWNITMNENQASVRCENHQVIEANNNPVKPNTADFSGTVISMIVDHTNFAKPTKMHNNLRENYQNEQ